MENSESLTERLKHFTSGDKLIAEAVLREVLPELHRVAVREWRREHNGGLLSPTELINEVWLRNLRNGGWQINSRQHFYSIAALAMRQVLVDLARTRSAQKRGNGKSAEPLHGRTEMLQADNANPETLVQVGILMERLEKQNAETARIVDLHYFVGFTLEEIAEITGLAFRQVRHHWERGRDWLKDGLRP